MADTEIISVGQMAKRDLEQELTALERLLKGQSAEIFTIGSDSSNIKVGRNTVEGQTIISAIDQIIEYKKERIKLIFRQTSEQL